MSQSSPQPQAVNITDQLTACPECDYTDGFHVGFVRNDDGELAIILVCPKCSARFDIRTTLQQSEADL
ncbi:MAG: hypothetical protein ACYS8X_05665 [Planctomycetota bacterium]|jgi:hypothetical protein